jgi:hypothetical protein
MRCRLLRNRIDFASSKSSAYNASQHWHHSVYGRNQSNIVHVMPASFFEITIFRVRMAENARLVLEFHNPSTGAQSRAGQGFVHVPRLHIYVDIELTVYYLCNTRTRAVRETGRSSSCTSAASLHINCIEDPLAPQRSRVLCPRRTVLQSPHHGLTSPGPRTIVAKMDPREPRVLRLNGYQRAK